MLVVTPLSLPITKKLNKLFIGNFLSYTIYILKTQNYKDLQALIISNPSQGIEECQKIICSATKFDSYQSFYNYHQHHPHLSSCQKEWTNGRMSIHCFDCANNPQSQICLQCFLNGNHQDHDYIILPNSTGNCDCGDLSLWKRSGFCEKHRGEEDDSHPEKYIDEKLRLILTEKVFKAIFISLKKLQTDTDSKFKSIFQFLTSFIKFGDGFRRLISITLIEKVDFENFLNDIFESSSEFNQLFQQLCSGLITDNYFKVNFSRIVYKLMIKQIIPKEIDSILSKIDDNNYKVWNSFWFHCFSPKPIEFNVTHFNWNWVSFVIEYSTEMKEFFGLKGLVEFDFNFPNYFNEINSNIPIASQIQPNEQTQKLFNELFSNVLNCGTKDGLKNGENDTIIVTSFNEEHEKSFYRAPFLFNKIFYDLLRCFLAKEKLKLDNLFVELDKSIDISQIYDLFNENENNRFISKYLKLSPQKNDGYLKSFHDGTSFYFSFPLFDSLAFLFRLDNLNRLKIARLLSTEKYQSLRIQLGIVTVKKLLSFVCYHQSLVSSNNISLKKFLGFAAKSSNSVLYGIPYYLPLFQLLLGLNDDFSLKEFYAFEIATEIGLFDDFNSKSYAEEEDITDKQTQMIFSFLYISILVVVERTLFNFDGHKFIEEQIILALKQGISNLDELNKAYDQEANKFTSIKQSFNKILSKVATLNKSGSEEGNDSSFYLKEEIKWNSISGINLFNNQKVILNNEITENPNKLLKIQEFEPEEKFFFLNKSHKNEIKIHLKDFLFTPTVLAIVYQTLRSKETGFPEVELNDHLAMNILVLISKFVEEKDEKSTFDETIEISYDSTLIDLISKLKEVVFKYTVDSDGNATIENTLNNFKAFNSLLRIKIGSTKFEPKSFIDLILEKDQLGKNVLKRMSIDINNKDDKKVESKPEEFNKRQVNKIKEKIINQFKNDIDNYRLNNLDLVDHQSSSNIFDNICSVCSTAKENQILSYPIYIYRTKFPFIIDKPPLIKINPLEEFSVDDDRDDEPDNELDEELINKKGEEEEEEEAPDLPRMISKLNEIDDHEEDELQSQLYSIMFDPDLLNRESRFLRNQRRKVLLEEKLERDKRRKSEEDELMKLKDKKTGKIEVEKRCTAGNNFVIQFGICQHLVHPDCVNKDLFKCPMDRSLKNGFLPAIDGLHKKVIFKNYEGKEKIQINSKTLSDDFKESLFLFVDNFASFFFKPNVDVFVELVKSISGLIATYEIRLRSLPDCLDSKKTKFLSRNLFLTTWYAYRSCGKPKMILTNNAEIDVESRLTVFQRFIKKLIEFDDLHSISNKSYDDKATFKKFVSSFSNFFTETNSKLRDKEILLFLRRVCLSDFFLLNNSVTFKKVEDHFIDWDEIFSPSNLTQRYGIQFKKLIEFEFKPFVFSKLPHEFLRFEGKPFNFPIEKTSKFTLFSILDYNSLIGSFDDFCDSEKVDENDEELKMNQKNVHSLQFDNEELNFHLLFKHEKRVYPTIWLFVGKAASKVVITNMGKIGVLKPFYLDTFGCSDIGFKRGQPLYLNEERYERTMDEILSGDFSHYLPL